MPTLSADTQAVLATDKVRFQGQEVAFVVADDRYAARDALELIDVEYEPLPVVIDARQALDPDAPVIRDDKEGQTDNHIFDWEAGDEAEADARLRRRRRRGGHAGHPVPARAPRARWRRAASVADYDAVTGKLRCGARRRRRTPTARCTRIVAGPAGAQDPGDRARHRRRLRQQGPDLPRLRLLDRRLDRDRQAGQVDGGPHREPDVDGLRPRLPDARQDRRRRATAGSAALRVDVLADHGAFNATAQPTKYPAGFFHIFTGSYDLEAAHCTVRGVYTNKAPGRRRLPLLVPRDRGGVPRRADGRPARGRARRWTPPSCG